MSDIIQNIVNLIINSFDFGYCVIINVATYLIIKLIDELNGNKVVPVWGKRLVLITTILIIGTAYYFIDHNPKLLLNSSILAPVFWTWILKPICKKLDIDYKKIDDVM